MHTDRHGWGNHELTNEYEAYLAADYVEYPGGKLKLLMNAKSMGTDRPAATLNKLLR